MAAPHSLPVVSVYAHTLHTIYKSVAYTYIRSRINKSIATDFRMFRHIGLCHVAETFCNQMNTKMHCVFVISTCDKDTHTSHTLQHWGIPFVTWHTLPHWVTPSHTRAHPIHMILVLGITFFVRFPSLLHVSQQGVWKDCTTFCIVNWHFPILNILSNTLSSIAKQKPYYRHHVMPFNTTSQTLLTVVNGKVVLSVQADQHYHTKVTGTAWCIENVTIFPFAIYVTG